MGILDSVMRKSPEISWIYDLELFQDTSTRAYVKRMALQTCIEFVARTIAQSEFRITDNHKIIKDNMYYKLNVRPNTDLSSTDFWQKVIYKLINKNEVLIVVSETKDLLIVDDFERVEYALYPDLFKHVVIGEYEFKRTFNMDEVIYLNYNNEKLRSFTDGLFDDYAEIFGKMIGAQMRNYTFKGILKLDSSKTPNKEEAKKQKEYIKSIFDGFANKSVSIAPLMGNMEFQDLSNSNKSNNAPFDDIDKLIKSILDIVARAIGIPPSLIRGEMADMANALDSYSKFCISPLLKKIENELNAKLFKEKEFLSGKRLKVVGIDKVNPLEMAESIEKLVSSGVFNRNQIRIMLGEEPVDNAEMDIYYITKNYERANNEKEVLKGGEKNEFKD